MRICIEGNVGVGKSSVLAALSSSHVIYPEPVDLWEPLLQLFYNNKQRYACAMNAQVLLHYATVPDADPRGRPVLVERSPLSCVEVFSRMQKNEGDMTEKEFQLLCDLQEDCGWTPDVIIHLTAPVPLCHARTVARGRKSEATVGEDYLNKLQFYYTTMLTWYKPELHVVDATQDSSVVAARVMDIVQAYTT